MDLHLTSAVATDEERAAVDALLGPPETGWVGGARDGGVETRFARGGPSRAGAAGPVAPGAARVAVRRRMDQRGRPELRVPAIDRPAGGGVRRRDVLRDVQRRAAAEDGRARVRRPRMPPGRRRACAPSSSAPPARRTRAGADAVASWVRSPCLGMCERAPGGPGPARGRRGGRRVRSRDRDAGPEPARRRHARGGVRAADRPGGRVRATDVGRRRPVRPAAAAARRRGGPELDRRLPGARRVRGAAPRARARARRARSARSRTPSCWAAAARRSRPG